MTAFSATDLVVKLARAQAMWPGLKLIRSREGTGNLCVLDDQGDYVAVVVLRDPPELVEWGDDLDSRFVLSANDPFDDDQGFGE